MKVVVVGGTGMVGLGIVRALQTFGHEVTVVTRGRRSDPRLEGVRFIQGDKRSGPLFERRMQQEPFDVAIDLVCYNAEDARSTLRAFRHARHIIHCSTAGTYGFPLPELPVREDAPNAPASDYTRNKAAADDVLLQAHRNGVVPVTIFKPGYIYGPQWVVLRQLGFDPGWIDRMRKGKPIIVADDGQTLWSQCHCDDAGLAFAAAAGRECCFGEIYNLCDPAPLSWLEYHERAAAALGLRVEPVLMPADTILASPLKQRAYMFATQTRWPQWYDVGKLQRDIPEFAPRVSLEEGIRECVQAMERYGTMQNSDNDTLEDLLISRHLGRPDQRPPRMRITKAPWTPVGRRL